MALLTGTPVGNLVTSQQIYVDTPPTFFFQEKFTAAGVDVGTLNNPDGEGFFWNLSGTTANPVYEGGCYEDFTFTDVREINMVRCDTEGDRLAIQKRTSMQITFTLKEFFKLTKLRHMLNMGPVTTTVGQTEKLGIGQIDNSKFYYAYFPSVYDPNTADHISVTLHRCQFTAAWAISYEFGNAATVGVEITGFADTTRPAPQLYGTVIRSDPSAL